VALQSRACVADAGSVSLWRFDADQQRAIISLVTSRARQALPGVANRVLNEWTSTLVAANRERRSRQRSAERRVDIAGSGGAGNDGRRSL
jgi:hypothetical protein